MYEFTISTKGEAGADPVTRRLRVPGCLTLDDLHVCIQKAFGWDRLPARRYVFEIGEVRILPLDPEVDVEDARLRDSEFTSLDALALQKGDVFRYVYDLAEFHVHEIVTEAVCSSARSGTRPRCLGGEGGLRGDPCTTFDPGTVNRSLAAIFASLDSEEG